MIVGSWFRGVAGVGALVVEDACTAASDARGVRPRRREAVVIAGALG